MNTLTLALKTLKYRLLTALVLVGLMLTPLGSVAPLAGQPTVGVIVQGSDIATAAASVHSVGGTVTHELGIINAVGAQLTAAQLAALQGLNGISRIYENRRVEVTCGGGGGGGGGDDVLDTVYPTLVGADQLHEQGIEGSGVTVAVLDTGLWAIDPLEEGTNQQPRVLVQYDAILDELSERRMHGVQTTDDSGHGTHVTSVILSSLHTRYPDWKYNGIAPNVSLVSVKAFDADGAGSYMDVIRGLDWAVTNKDTYGIWVLNLSFSAPPQSYYWDDPLNQAVMRA